MLSCFKVFYPSQICVYGKAVPVHTIKEYGGLKVQLHFGQLHLLPVLSPGKGTRYPFTRRPDGRAGRHVLETRGIFFPCRHSKHVFSFAQSTSTKWDYFSRPRRCCPEQPLNGISGCRREVDENCALLGCYTTTSGNSLPQFLSLEAGTNRLSRNIGTELPLLAA